MTKINATNNLTIKELNEDDRPREKLLAKGAGALSDAELMAILIGSGSRNESAVDLCRRIIKDNEYNLNSVSRLSINDLIKYKGIGNAKAITIIAALEFAKRIRKSDVLDKKKIERSSDLYEIFEIQIADLIHEEFWVAFLNAANRVIDVVKLTQGGTRQTVVDVPMLLRLSLEKRAHSIAVAHNHPSGEVNPSKEDFNITIKIKNACEVIGIRFLDHLIIGNKKYYSFADEGRI